MGIKRELHPKCLEMIDARLVGNPLALDIIREKDRERARTLIVLVAQSLVGIREVGGNNKGHEVELIQETIGRAESESWCMSFDQTVLAYVEFKLGITSPIPPSESCDFVWTHTDTLQRVRAIPLGGAFVLWGHYDSGGHYKGGHTGIVMSANADMFDAIEGNTMGGLGTHDRVIRDGGGVYHTRRSMAGNGDMRVRGFLKPF